MNRVLQPRPLVVLGLNVWMGTAAGADELVEMPAQNSQALAEVVGPSRWLARSFFSGSDCITTCG